jgi:drug/metabolite transporter (DMT)-like permease
VPALSASALLVFSAFLHALWNAILKRDHEPRVNVIGVLLLAALGATIALPFLNGPAFPHFFGFSAGIAAGLCEGGYFATLALSLERAPLGITYTLSRGTALILVWLGCALTDAASLTLPHLAGAGLILAGLVLTQPAATAERGTLRSRGVLWAYVCGLFIASYHFFYRHAMRDGAQPIALFSLSIWVGLAAYLPFAGRGILSRLREKILQGPLWLAGGGVFCAGSFLIFLSALRTTDPGVAISLRNTSVIFAQFFSLAIGDRVSTRQWAGALLVAAGAGWMSTAG